LDLHTGKGETEEVRAGVNIYPKENDLPLPFAPTNICPLGCLNGMVNVDVDERGRAGPTTNLLQFATF
jgi:hypothetical protein